jgi:DNA (cytosine-5)-methyltransferase 1
MKNHKFKFIDLFAGIGGMRIPFEKLGGKCVFTSEWDKDAAKMYEANFGDFPAGDITKIDAENIPNHDVLLGGFPCQAFSIIGKMNGFQDTRGTLFFDVERILRTKRPAAFLLENVKMLVGHQNGCTFKVILNHLESLGYFVHWKVLNALDFGLPQKRERVFIVGFLKNYDFRFPEGMPGKYKSLSEILEKDVPNKYYASEHITNKRKAAHTPKCTPSIWHENKGGNISSYPFSCALRANASYNYLLVNGKRRLTPRESLRLLGFPDSFKIVGNDSQLRKITGNGVCVPVVKAVATELVKCLSGEVPLRSKRIPAKSTQSVLPFENIGMRNN